LKFPEIQQFRGIFLFLSPTKKCRFKNLKMSHSVVENIKPVDPLLYSQLIHQKNIGFMKRKMHFNPGQF